MFSGEGAGSESAWSAPYLALPFTPHDTQQDRKTFLGVRLLMSKTGLTVIPQGGICEEREKLYSCKILGCICHATIH